MRGYFYCDSTDGTYVWFQSDGDAVAMIVYPDEHALLAEHPGALCVSEDHANRLMP